MTAQQLARMLEEFLAEAPSAVLVEDGAALFDLAHARYSVTDEHDRCLLQVWSEERNVVRRVVDAELKSGALRLSVQKFGHARPHTVEICRDRDRRTPGAKKAARAQYRRLLERVLLREFPGWQPDRLTSNLYLERSFGPVHVRGILRRARSAFAVAGVSAAETQASIDAALTTGLLWLDYCRERDPRVVVEGLRLFVPTGASAVVRARMARLNSAAAKFELYEVNERDEVVEPIDIADGGNIATRLVRCPDPVQSKERFAAQIATVRALLPEAEVAVLTPAEIAFRYLGLEFARARMAPVADSFGTATELVFGAAGNEQRLCEETQECFAAFVLQLRVRRHPAGDKRDVLFRMQPERWLESLLVASIEDLDKRLDASHVYSQVPAFAASDRAMIDVLAATRDGRLAVLELKADEDIHLPLQGLDYWARVGWHHQRGEFTANGYFPGRLLSGDQPLLLLVAPALHVHPATDTLLRYLDPRIDWTLLGVDERWRERVRVVFRKRREDITRAATQR